MGEIRSGIVTEVRDLGPSLSNPELIVGVLGDLTAGQGLWRFYSASFPEGGVEAWNSCDSSWRQAWGATLGTLDAFGEDVFGNQLLLRPDGQSVLIWRHESGVIEDTELDLATILEASLSNALDWLDFYSDGSPAVARLFRDEISKDRHLHWVTPLVLGGSVDASNILLVERVTHLLGHAKLWQQIGDLPAGASIHLKP